MPMPLASGHSPEQEQDASPQVRSQLCPQEPFDLKTQSGYLFIFTPKLGNRNATVHTRLVPNKSVTPGFMQDAPHTEANG